MYQVFGDTGPSRFSEPVFEADSSGSGSDCHVRGDDGALADTIPAVDDCPHALSLMIRLSLDTRSNVIEEQDIWIDATSNPVLVSGERQVVEQSWSGDVECARIPPLDESTSYCGSESALTKPLDRKSVV